jgi:hypothetical protein
MVQDLGGGEYFFLVGYYNKVHIDRRRRIAAYIIFEAGQQIVVQGPMPFSIPTCWVFHYPSSLRKERQALKKLYNRPYWN